MRYLPEEDCREHCDYHQVCIRFGKLYRDGCVLDGEGYEEGSPDVLEERENRIKRLQQKIAEM